MFMTQLYTNTYVCMNICMYNRIENWENIYDICFIWIEAACYDNLKLEL